MALSRSLPVLIDRAAIGTGIPVSDLLSVAAIPLSMVAPEEAGYLDLKLVLLIVPLFMPALRSMHAGEGAHDLIGVLIQTLGHLEGLGDVIVHIVLP